MTHDSPPPMRDQLREAVLLLREVADCGALDIDARLDYVEVQIDRDTWLRLAAYRSVGGATNGDEEAA